MGMPLPPGYVTWSGFQLALGHFSHATNPTPYWNHNLYQILSVFTRENGKALDDWTLAPFLEVNAQKLHIAPFALELMTDAQALPQPFAAGSAYLTYPGSLKSLHDDLSMLGSYAYAGGTQPVGVTSGPVVKQWATVGSLGYVLPRWASGPTEEDWYVTPNYRFRLRLAVDCDAGIKEVKLYDGMTLWRRFLPQGAKAFDTTLEVLNDHHGHYVAVITDL